eukprot:gene14965-17694_t
MSLTACRNSTNVLVNSNRMIMQQQQRSFFSKSSPLYNTPAATTSSPAASLSTTSSGAFSNLFKEEGKKDDTKAKVAIATLRNLPYSQWKMMPLFKALTGLSYREAIAQLTYANIGPANQLKGLMTSARYNAEYYKNLDPDRLVVSQIWTGRSYYQSRIEFKGRGRTGIRRKPFSHVTVELKEVAKVEGEKKLGKFGKTHKTIENYNNPLQI